MYNYDDFEAVTIPRTLDCNPKRKSVGYMLKDEHIWHWISLYEAVEIMNFVKLRTRQNGSMYAEYSQAIQNEYEVKWAPGKSGTGNYTLYKKILRLMKEGDGIERLRYLAENTKIERHLAERQPDGIERFLTKIERPVIERETDNLNAKTFDFVTVECHILKAEHCDTDRVEYIRQHRHEIDRKVLEAINKSRSFKSYGVPVNILKLNNLHLVRDSLIYRFGIKEKKK